MKYSTYADVKELVQILTLLLVCWRVLELDAYVKMGSCEILMEFVLCDQIAVSIIA